MATSIREKVPIIIHHAAEQEGCPPQVELLARRFMGVLKHPVPRPEMLRECGADRVGEKVVVEWPLAMQECPVEAGDTLGVEGTTYRVAQVKRHSHFLDLYLGPRV